MCESEIHFCHLFAEFYVLSAEKNIKLHSAVVKYKHIKPPSVFGLHLQ